MELNILTKKYQEAFNNQDIDKLKAYSKRCYTKRLGKKRKWFK